jgi:glutamate carboxypeptidase
LKSGSEILDLIRSRRSDWLDALASLVEHESPSRDKSSLDPLARKIVGRLQAIGGEVLVIANPEGGDHVLGLFFGEVSNLKPALVLGHYDTVWPLGTLATMPFRVEGDMAFGPGIFDMKASLVEAEFAIDAIQKLGLKPPRPIFILITSDEEIGSPKSRPLIEEMAGNSAYALVVEPPLPDGSLKTARKGVGHFVVEVEGKAAHAGVEPRKGISAIQELAQQILYLHALTDFDAGITVNVGMIEGGTTPNVVAARASARVDVRATTLAQAEMIEQAIRQTSPYLAGTRLTISGGFNRPPMERTDAVANLFEQARDIGRSMGLELGEGSTGGGSDGNFTAAIGIPTLDGLGIRGAGAHATHEQIDLDSFPERATLLAMLLLQLTIPDET